MSRRLNILLILAAVLCANIYSTVTISAETLSRSDKNIDHNERTDRTGQLEKDIQENAATKEQPGSDCQEEQSG